MVLKLHCSSFPPRCFHKLFRHFGKHTFPINHSEPFNIYSESLASPVCSSVSEVMHLFFLERFVSPQEWHRARQGYARSTAVNAIVGGG
jgi:hypothetical protein